MEIKVNNQDDHPRYLAIFPTVCKEHITSLCECIRLPLKYEKIEPKTEKTVSL